MSKDTSGCAFPCQPLNGQFATREMDYGMSLRDYFAAKAMQSMVASVEDAKPYQYLRQISSESYLIADAMLKARES